MRKSKLMHEHRSGNNNVKVTEKKKLEFFRVTDGVMKFGKHKGKKLSEVPQSYLRWMLKEMDLPKSRKDAIKDILL